MDKLINGKIIKMTDAEITAHNNDVKNINEEMKIIFDKETERQKKKKSALAKLKKLGLDEDEIKALF
jgi:hypothetical protein